MRLSVAVFFVAVSVWPCTICTCEYTPNESFSKSDNIIFNDVISCARSLGLEKCITAFGIWKAERALKHQETHNNFTWHDYNNHSDEELYSRLCEDTEKLLRNRPLTMNLGEHFLMTMKSTGNMSLSFDILKNKDISTARTSMKKMTKMFYQVLPLLILPGIVMSAILPFFLPTLKMATLATGMLNNMALTGAVFALLRDNAFNDKRYKKVIYVNAGYGKPHYNRFVEPPLEPLDDGASDFEPQLSTEVTHDLKEYHLVGVDPNTGISYPFNEDWLKNTVNNHDKVKNVQIIGEVPSQENDWRNSLKWPQHSNT